MREHNVSFLQHTNRRRLWEANLKSNRSQRGPELTPDHRTGQLQFACDNVYWGKAD